MSTRTESRCFRFSVTFESCIEYKIQPSERLLFLKASLQLILIPSIAIYWLTYSFQTSSLIANFRGSDCGRLLAWAMQRLSFCVIPVQSWHSALRSVRDPEAKLFAPQSLPVQFWYIEKSKIIRLRIAIIVIKRNVRET